MVRLYIIAVGCRSSFKRLSNNILISFVLVLIYLQPVMMLKRLIFLFLLVCSCCQRQRLPFISVLFFLPWCEYLHRMRTKSQNNCYNSWYVIVFDLFLEFLEFNFRLVMNQQPFLYHITIINFKIVILLTIIIILVSCLKTLFELMNVDSIVNILLLLLLEEKILLVSNKITLLSVFTLNDFNLGNFGRDSSSTSLFMASCIHSYRSLLSLTSFNWYSITFCIWDIIKNLFVCEGTYTWRCGYHLPSWWMFDSNSSYPSGCQTLVV